MDVIAIEIYYCKKLSNVIKYFFPLKFKRNLIYFPLKFKSCSCIFCFIICIYSLLAKIIKITNIK